MHLRRSIPNDTLTLADLERALKQFAPPQIDVHPDDTEHPIVLRIAKLGYRIVERPRFVAARGMVLLFNGPNGDQPCGLIKLLDDGAAYCWFDERLPRA